MPMPNLLPQLATCGSVRFKKILNLFSNRLDPAKLFRRRLQVPPFNIVHPY